MPAVWPSTLPPRLKVEGYRETAPDTALRTEMDAGPPKLRQRYTAGIRRIDDAMVLTKAQVDLLDVFYVTTLAGGTLPFDWTDRTGATKSFRFVEPPSYEPIDTQVWRAQLRLEILP